MHILGTETFIRRTVLPSGITAAISMAEVCLEMPVLLAIKAVVVSVKVVSTVVVFYGVVFHVLVGKV